MAVIETWYNQDLQQPVKVHYLDGSMFSHNGNGNRIGVHVFNNGEPVTLSGTVSGYVVTADGSTVPCTGSRSGNSASILIPAAAYQPGAVFITIFLTDGSTVTTLASVATNVLTARTNNQVAPGSVVTDWTNTINAAMQAVVDANAANMAQPYANLTFPVPLGKYCIQNNLLYRCKTPIPSSEEWTSGHWVRVKIADEVETLNNEVKQVAKVAPFDLIGVVRANVRTGVSVTTVANYLSYDTPVFSGGHNYLISARLNSNVAGSWQLCAIKPNKSGYVSSNIQTKTVVAGEDTIFNAIFSPAQDYIIGFINNTGSDATVETEIYVYDVTGINMTGVVFQGLVKNGFAVMSLNDPAQDAQIAAVGERVTGTENRIAQLEEVVKADIVSPITTNTKTLTNATGGLINKWQSVVLTAGRTYFISATMTVDTAMNAMNLGIARSSMSGWLNASLVSKRITSGVPAYFNAVYTPAEAAVVAFNFQSSLVLNGSVSLYVYDVTGMDVSTLDIGSEVVVDKSFATTSLVAVTAENAKNAEHATSVDLADDSKLLQMGDIIKAQACSGKNWYLPLNWTTWEFDHSYLFIIVGSFDGIDTSGPIGFLNSSGSWAGRLQITGSGDGFKWVIGQAPSTAAAHSDAKLVCTNQATVNVVVKIYDLANTTYTDEQIALLATGAQSVNGITLAQLIMDGVEFDPAVLAGKLNNSWNGKNVLFIGDSLTAAQKYQYTVRSLLGINIFNHCKGGMGIIQCVDGENGAPPFDPDDYHAGTLYPLRSDEVAGKDLIVFYAGYNNRGTPDGEVGDCYDPNDSSHGRTIAGYMQYAINRIYEELVTAGNLTCHILIVTVDCAGKYPYIDADGYDQYPSGSGRTMETLANIQKAVANANSLPCVDLWHDSGINRNTWTVFGANPNAYIENPDPSSTAPYPHNGDQLHKSDAGYKRIGECIVGGVLEAYGN